MAKGSNWKHILVGILAVAAVGMSVGTLVHVTRTEETKTVSTFAFERGKVNEDGTIDDESDEAIVSELITIDGLTVKLDKAAEIDYKLHYYNEDKEYVESTTALSTNFDSAETVVPETAEYVCVEIIPESDLDGISLFEFWDYVGQITVKVNK